MIRPSSNASNDKSDVQLNLSPDMKNARFRLGHLLHGIRKGDIATAGDDNDE